MWKTRIYLSKKFIHLRRYLEDKLSRVRGASFTTIAGRGRAELLVACDENAVDTVRPQVIQVLKELFLNKVKFSYIYNNLNKPPINHAVCAFFAVTINHKTIYENDFLSKLLDSQDDYNIEGMLNFKMQGMLDMWDELVIFAESVLEEFEEDELFSLASYFIEAEALSPLSIFVTGTNGEYILTDVTNGQIISIENVYAELELNLINSILSAVPTEILIEPRWRSPILHTLNKVCKVKSI